MFKQRTPAEKEEIRRRNGTFLADLESIERIDEIAKDSIEHYCNDILINGFKPQVVASSMAEGRKPETEGISITEAPFYDLLKNNIADANENEIIKTNELTHTLILILKETATITNFWTDKASERKRIEGLAEDELRYSGIE